MQLPKLSLYNPDSHVAWIVLTSSPLLQFVSAMVQYGEVKDLAIMYDKSTGQPAGYAFVSYATRGEADRAIAVLDGKMHIPGSAVCLKVGVCRLHLVFVSRMTAAHPSFNNRLIPMQVALAHFLTNHQHANFSSSAQCFSRL